MSEWLRLMNEMKQRRPQDYFTPTQLIAYESLMERLQFPNQRLNLYGPPGSGKTFIAWGLVKDLDAIHLPVSDRLREYDGYDMSVLVIDNAPTYEDELRGLLADAALIGAGSIIFITNRPASLQMRRIHLDHPSNDDIRHVARTFGRLGFYEQVTPPMSANFWKLLQCYV